MLLWGFLHRVHRQDRTIPVSPRRGYAGNPEFNESVDELHERVRIFDEEFDPSRVLFEMAPGAVSRLPRRIFAAVAGAMRPQTVPRRRLMHHDRPRRYRICRRTGCPRLARKPRLARQA